ncbi:MAG: thioredoxin domain-containing protein [Nitrospinota bacterium]|nr:MAG: thioredoxin domain-containing protein [Nitrospinota bacterium]
MSHAYTNRLIHETSPYLRQHAHNPVDWYPWGPEALEKARREDKPILLSIGYSACHWCHVMEHESFENPRIAELMNRYFVNIKVDREERPDLDQIYQNVVQMFGQGGGWPLTMFLTPDQKPFYGGTYFPPEDRFGRPGFPRVLLAVAQHYRERKEDVEHTVMQVMEGLERINTLRDVGYPLDRSIIENAVRKLLNYFDTVNGGFGQQPKFPNPMNLALFLRYSHAAQNETYRDLALLALRKMACGGIYDQLGGGFHRYAVDSQWLVPHFEKMLYDNALLLPVYGDAYRLTRDELFRRVILETLAYLRREMLHPEGGFYATQDADSEGEEGKFYLWQKAEILQLLGPEAGEIFCHHYGVTEGGNFEQGQNILHINASLEQTARQFQLSPETVAQILEEGKKRLFTAREARVRPFRDEKILTAWNGLMLSALADAYRLFGDEVYAGDIRRTVDFLTTHLYEQGRLLAVYKDGVAKLNGYLDDYAFLVRGLIDAYEATFVPRYLDLAHTLHQAMIELFWDGEQGGFFFTGRDHEPLLTRPKTAYDHAIPSGNSVAVHNLLWFHYYTGEERYLQQAEQVLRLVRTQMEEQPFGYGNLLCALDFYLRTPQEIVLLGKREAPETREMLEAINRCYLPNRVLTLASPEESSPSPLLAGKGQVEGKTTAYVCQNFACSPPVTTVSDLLSLLQPDRE